MEDRNLDFNSLVKKHKPDNGIRKLRIAVLAEFASQHLVKALQAAGAMNNFRVEIWEAEYDTIASSIFDETSELYNRHFDYVIIYYSPFKLYKEFSYHQTKSDFADAKVMGISALLALLQERIKVRVIISNYDEIDDSIWGNFANKTDKSFLFQVRKLNLGLMQLAGQRGNIEILDVHQLVAEKGRAAIFSPRLYVLADLIYDLDFMALLAQETWRVIKTAEGSFVKCIIIDLDNTIWGGIIGDDGLSNIEIGELGLGKAFSNLQLWLKNLKERGILLAVCSKNDDQIAKAVFRDHEAMILGLDDIAVFVANWETKVDNIMFIQSVLNIGFDSMVFIDDNPFERQMVEQHIPGIIVPDLPEDPAEMLPYLQSLRLFETASYADADAVRTQQYQEESNRVALQKKFTSEADFLLSLNMQAVCKPVDSFSCPRVAQLTQRSNQFNLRTRRYTEGEIEDLIEHSCKHVLTLSLTDKFGNYGLVSAVILERYSEDEMFIDTWIMSCRVLKRSVESLMLNEIVDLAKSRGYRWLVGEYIPTAKNGLVKDHYRLLGFTPVNQSGIWRLSLENYDPKTTFITKTKQYAFND